MTRPREPGLDRGVSRRRGLEGDSGTRALDRRATHHVRCRELGLRRTFRDGDGEDPRSGQIRRECPRQTIWRRNDGLTLGNEPRGQWSTDAVGRDVGESIVLELEGEAAISEAPDGPPILDRRLGQIVVLQEVARRRLHLHTEAIAPRAWGRRLERARGSCRFIGQKAAGLKLICGRLPSVLFPARTATTLDAPFLYSAWHALTRVRGDVPPGSASAPKRSRASARLASMTGVFRGPFFPRSRP